MKKILFASAFVLTLASCEQQKKEENVDQKDQSNKLSGTWQLITSRVITKGDTAVTFAAKDQKMIKMFNDTHFAFIKHDLNHGKDSASAVFDAGGGQYTYDGNKYSEHLEYCNYRGWENHDFNFTLAIQNDTLIQTGVEKIDSLGIDQVIIEEYVKVK